MIVVDGQKSYQGAYAERVQNRQLTHQMTETKKDAVFLSEEVYRAILKAAPIPNVAVGGITAQNCIRPLGCGATGLAISAGILKAKSPAKEVRNIRKYLEEFSI